jgi:hypothetical protein
MLAEVGEPVSPSNLSRMLKEVGRDDPPLAVGKALDHLQGKQRAKTIGRAMWVLTGQDEPRVAPPTTDAAQEKEVSSDQEVNGAALALTGGSQQPDESPDQY